MLLTTIIPVYNKINTLEQTLNSIVENHGLDDQQYELILIDDESTDGSDQICKQFCEQYPYINYYKIFNDKTPYCSRARNIGISLARGKYIHFLDADDLLCKSFYPDGVFYLEYQRDIDIFTRSRYNSGLPGVLQFDKVHSLYGPPLQCCIFRDFIKQYRFENIWVEDAIFTTRLLYHHKCYFDKYNFNSYNYLVENSELNKLATENIGDKGNWIFFLVEHLQNDDEYPFYIKGKTIYTKANDIPVTLQFE